MTTQQKIPVFYGWINTAILFTIYFVALGLVFYGFSAIFPAMIKTMGWKRGDAALAHTLNLLLMGLMTPFLAIMLNRFGSRKIMGVGLTVLVTGLVLLSTVTSELWQWILVWGFLMSFGFCFAGLLTIQFTIVQWFNIRRATVLGIVMSGSAVGGFIAQPFYTWLMEYTEAWQSGWITGGIFALLALLLSFWIRNKPEDLGQFPDGINPDETEDAAENPGTTRTYRTQEVWNMQEIIRTRTLYIIMIVMIAHGMPIFMVTTHAVLHLTDVGYTQMQAASVLSFIILGSGIARFPMGWLADRIEPRLILTGAMALMAIGLIGIWKAPSIPVLMVCGPIFGFAYGTALIMFPTIIANYFGPELFASINGFLIPFIIPFGASVPVAAGYMADRFGNYDLPFTFLGIVLAGSVIFAVLLSPPKRNTQEQ